MLCIIKKMDVILYTQHSIRFMIFLSFMVTCEKYGLYYIECERIVYILNVQNSNIIITNV